MDLSDTIRSLYEEKKQLDKVIQALEVLARTEPEAGAVGEEQPKASRRGRTSMSGEEREQVSARMKAYWDKRRKAAGQPEEALSQNDSF